MKTYQEKAEAYVRQQLPELMELSFGCEVDTGVPRIVYELRGDTVITLAGGIRFSNKLEDLEASKHWKIIGHPIQLQHWLRVLGERRWSYINQGTYFGAYDNDNDCEEIKFNLTTGQPATEADYQAYCEIVGVE